MMRYRKLLIATALAVGLAGAGLFMARTAAAQGPDGQGMPGAMGAFNVCSATDYTEVAAKALGMTAPELRVALVGGKSLDTIAQDKKVDYKTVTDAIQAAETADIDQAVKDGLLTDTQAAALKTALTTMASRTSRMPNMGRMPGVLVGRGLFDGVSARNVVKPMVAASGALGMTCPDLAKALEGGKSIATVASDKNVQLQTVIDALVKAYQDALSKDLDEGLISKVQADAAKARVLDEVLMEISRSGLAGGRMGMFGLGERLGQGNQPGNMPGLPFRDGSRNRGGNQPSTDVTPTPAPGK
jgi:hypothetical protein